MDAVESQVRVLLGEYPKMPATVIAERIGWPHSITVLKDRIRQIRPEYAGVDPSDRPVYRAGEITQCDLWFPGVPVPVGFGQETTTLPVLVMTNTFSRTFNAIMLPSRQGGDLTAGMWSLIQQTGRVAKTLLWDLESAIGGNGKVSLVGSPSLAGAVVLLVLAFGVVEAGGVVAAGDLGLLADGGVVEALDGCLGLFGGFA